MSDKETIKANAEADELTVKLRLEQKCHICKKPGVMVCACGDYWCDFDYSHCYKKECKNWGYTMDGYKHSWCRSHVAMAEYPDGKIEEEPNPKLKLKNI